MDPITQFNQAVDQTSLIVAGVKPDQMGQPTPCSEFDVRALLNHIIGTLHMAEGGANGAELDLAVFGQDLAGEDPASAFNAQAAKAKQATAKDGVLDAMWNMPFGTVPGGIGVSVMTLEQLQHGWDLARATGQQIDFDPELSEAGMQLAQLFPAEQIRQPGVYGPEAECPTSAPAHDRLAAFLGREV